MDVYWGPNFFNEHITTQLGSVSKETLKSEFNCINPVPTCIK